MGFSQFWLNMADKEIKVHRQVIRMIFPMIQKDVKRQVNVETATCLRQCHRVGQFLMPTLSGKLLNLLI